MREYFLLMVLVGVMSVPMFMWVNKAVSQLAYDTLNFSVMEKTNDY